MTFLFWNLNGRPLERLVADLVEEHEVDVLLLVENKIHPTVLVKALNRNPGSVYFEALNFNEKVSVFSRLPQSSIVPLRDEGGISLQRLRPPVGLDIILVIAHLQSKLHAQPDDQTLYCQRMARMIDDAERSAGHFRTIIVGDLNMNPFETGIAAADGLHGVMSRRIAQRQSRTIADVERRFFYNPMWARFGDNSTGPPGTYYYHSSHQVSFFWQMFDQVLVRPDLLPYFRDEEMKILTKTRTAELLTRSSIPDCASASDHLPLLFQLHIENP